MDVGALTSGLLTGLREGVEAALIVAIICAYLAKTGNRDQFPVSLPRGGPGDRPERRRSASSSSSRSASSRSRTSSCSKRQRSSLAAAVVTWMLFWMRRQARSVKGELHAAVDRAIDQGSVVALAYPRVHRHHPRRPRDGTVPRGPGEFRRERRHLGARRRDVGLLIAAVLGVGFYQGSRRFNLATFFRWTGVALIFIAAGLCQGCPRAHRDRRHHLRDATGLRRLGRAAPHDDGGNLIGQFLRALFGYSATPEVATFVVWLVYVVVVLFLFLRPSKPAVTAPATGSSAAAAR